VSTRRVSELSIDTPEGVTFSYLLATPVSRGLAWAIDAAAISAASSVLSKACQATGVLSSDLALALGVVLYFVVSIGYGIVLEWRWRGQTLGKRVLGLRVIDAQGLRLQFSQIALRNLVRALDLLPGLYLVGGSASLFSRYGQRLGDMAANTVVAQEQRRALPDLEQVAPARYNSLAAWPHLAARLRSLVNPRAVPIAVRAVASRDSLDPIARVEVFHDLAAYFQSLVDFPDSALEGLTDEQFVRSALRVIYGSLSGAATRN
jgi:uncharacterized RDD family membrane protein YckC